jgi:hypothetical protein
VTALQSTVRAITRTGRVALWRVDQATWNEIMAELAAWCASRGHPILHDDIYGLPLVCGCPVGVWPA